MLLNSTSPPIQENNKLCQSSLNPDESCGEIFSYVPLFMIFMSQFVLGIGNTLYLSLGQSYLDDNTSQKRSAMVFAYALAMRMTGPVMGFILTYFTSIVYIDPSLTPIIKPDDPRWLGAWWLGWIVIGIVMLILAILIGMFPENLPRKRKALDECTTDTEKMAKATLDVALNEAKDNPTWQGSVNLLRFHLSNVSGRPLSLLNANDFVSSICLIFRIFGIKIEFNRALIRLLKNKILMFNITQTIFSMIGATAFITFISRIMEVQFNKPGATGSLMNGSMSIFVSNFYFSSNFLSIQCDFWR